jgi:hypothetical protein
MICFSQTYKKNCKFGGLSNATLEQKATETHDLFKKGLNWSEMYDTCIMSEKEKASNPHGY